MGHTTALARVCNPHDRARCLDLELIVDAGITYTWIRRKRLESIGIRPSGTRRFRTIEGRAVEVMGVEALEGLGLEVDPVTRQLRRSESMLAITALDDRP